MPDPIDDPDLFARLGMYVIEPDHTVRRARDIVDWAAHHDIALRRIARDEVDGVTVSTVFLGVDHAFGSGPPILFETMVFGGPRDREQWRWQTWVEAEAGHVVVLELVRDSVAK